MHVRVRVCVCDSSYCTGVLISVIGTVVCGAKLNIDDLTVTYECVNCTDYDWFFVTCRRT